MTLLDRLSIQQEQLQALEQVLLQERQLLLARDIDGRELERLSGTKSTLLAAVEQAEAERRELQRQEGWELNTRGALAAASQAGCEELWAGIMQLGEQIARENRRNGELVGLRMSQNQRLLNALHDMRGHHLYGPDGQSSRRGSQLDSRA